MPTLERLHTLNRILNQRRTPITLDNLAEELECTPRTARRCIEYLRDRCRAPIAQTPDRRGWLYRLPEHRRPFELPGLWLNADELHALLGVQRLLSTLGQDALEEKLAPLQDLIADMLGKQAPDPDQLAASIHLDPIGSRPLQQRTFAAVCRALAERKQLLLHYRPRSHNDSKPRQVAPQRLHWYRGNWYLHAWCHRREALRAFSLDRIDQASVLQDPVQDYPEPQLDEHYHSGYGIFGGPARHTATLRFEPRIARWVSEEQWHPNQNGQWLVDGRYELKLPYSNATELVMDILRYGPDVEVVGPKALRDRVRARLEAAAERYRNDER